MAAKLAAADKGRWTIQQNAEINVTPFVDVMLVLLIIFMVAAPMATVAIAVDIPIAEPNQTPPPHPPIVLSVQKSGAVFIGDRPTSLPTLAADLPVVMQEMGVSGLPQNQRIVLRADADAVYAQFMDVTNALQDGGYHRIDLMTEEIE
ncbi:MAG: biopolymer transporter ExbD [Caulobacteraceae bacterium]|nr:MAG: biopolymer transporter ExbD [Caulobacteraceae bacterium]